MSVYDTDAFEERVEYARACILSEHTGHRDFDTCFESYDGDAVIVALFRIAADNPALQQRVQWTAHCLNAVAKYADVPTESLPRLAQELRVAGRGRAEVQYASFLQAQAKETP